MGFFDPDAAAAPGSGIFGLPHARGDAEVVLLPVPFDATTSYRPGAAGGPAAIAAASHQVDLFDTQTGRPYERGIYMLPIDEGLSALSRDARAAAQPVLDAGGVGPEHAAAIAAVERAGDEVNRFVRGHVESILDEGRVPGVVGGDHSVPFAAIAAIAERHGALGVLHIDAHADLRRAYAGFRWSHASILDNVVREVADVKQVVQVGVRDICGGEIAAIESSAGRVVTHFDIDWQRRLARGESYAVLAEEAVSELPEHVYVSFDIDGLDPTLCPHTGTPVPGGLSYPQACLVLEAVHESGRKIVGFDLCEVAPGPAGDEWDAAVGARVLYKLCGFALLGRDR